jgi:hypothetical protein
MRSQATLRAAVAIALVVAGAGTASSAEATVTLMSSPGSGRFDPVSVTFVSASAGWALGRSACSARTCLALRKTDDGGRLWTNVSLPRQLTVETGGGAPAVRFANTEDGWIYGNVPSDQTLKAAIWSTHDGGASWHAVAMAGFDPAQGGVLDLEAGGGRAYALVYKLDAVSAYENPLGLESTPVGEDAWGPEPAPGLGLPGGGGNVTGAIVLQGPTGWVVEGNDRGTSGSVRLVGGRWRAWVPPCATLGRSLAYPAAANAEDLAAVCLIGGFANPVPAAAPRGAVLGSAWLYESGDGGTTWSAVAQLGKHGEYYGAQLAHPTRASYVVSGLSQDKPVLEASFDGGRRWSIVHQGGLEYLGFTTASQGVAIAYGPGSSTSTYLLMTYDGGRTWSEVHS